MKKKRIERKLRKQFNHVVKLIPKHLRKDFEQHAYIAGGCFYSINNNKKVNDYDFFIDNQKLAGELKGYFTEFTHGDKIKRGKYKKHDILITQNAITIDRKYQIVFKYTGKPHDVCQEFDFRHNMFAYYREQIREYTDWRYLETKRISYNDTRTRDICGTLQRIPKMVEKGFIVPKSEISKMLKNLEEKGFTQAEKEIIRDNDTY